MVSGAPAHASRDFLGRARFALQCLTLVVAAHRAKGRPARRNRPATRPSSKRAAVSLDRRPFMSPSAACGAASGRSRERMYDKLPAKKKDLSGGVSKQCTQCHRFLPVAVLLHWRGLYWCERCALVELRNLQAPE